MQVDCLDTGGANFCINFAAKKVGFFPVDIQQRIPKM